MPSPPLNYLGCEPMIFPPKEDAGRMVARLALPSQPSHISAAPITTGYKRHGSNARVLRPKKVQKTKATLGPLYDVYLAPSPELLAQGRLPHMGALRPGLFHGKVGLLLGLRGDFMQKYEVRIVWRKESLFHHSQPKIEPVFPSSACIRSIILCHLLPPPPPHPPPSFPKTIQKPPKGRRAPREDLSVYTAEEKVERRKARAREYSNTARVRQEAAESEFKFDLGFMRSFRMMIEDAPNMFAVVTPDLEASVVYANGAFDRVANMAPKMVVGKPLWALIHEADHAAFREALVSVILTKKPPAEHVACRLVRKPSDGFLDVQVSLAMGTQGVLCVFWVV